VSSHQPTNPAPIGVFDSGVGGLTVLHECLVSLPGEDFVYLGDHARLPYGPRALAEVSGFSHQIAAYLEALGVKLIVVACNTATSAALPQLQASLSVPVVGVIAPSAAAAVRATRNRQIGLLATEGTVRAGRYQALIAALDAGTRVSAVACPKLVPLIEAGAQTAEAVGEYARPLLDEGCDTVILGCTHYPLIRPVFERVFGRSVTLVFSADETAREIAQTLARKGLSHPAGHTGTSRFYTTGDPGAFRELGERLLQMPLPDVSRISLDELDRAAA
jgi:glutamate racemase